MYSYYKILALFLVLYSFSLQFIYLMLRYCHVPLFVMPRTVAHLALSMGFSWQEYWSGLPFPPPGDPPHPGTEPASLTSPSFAGRFFTISDNNFYLLIPCPYIAPLLSLLSTGNHQFALYESVSFFFSYIHQFVLFFIFHI